MKKFRIIAVLMACLFVAAGCSVSEFGMVIDDQGVAVITAKNAGDGDSASAGSLKVEDNQEIVVESTIKEGGKIEITLSDASGKEDIDADIENVDEQEALWKVLVEAPITIYGSVPKGDYYVNAKVEGKADGEVKVYTRDIEDPDTWDKQATKEEALAAVGMESFEIPEGAEIGLGAVTAGEFRTHEGAVKVNVAYPAVDMFVYKAAEDINGGDPTYEANEYANEWTQDIDGITVTCYGNREGDATKTVWTKDGYSYAIIVHGLGGDIDFGLSADDLAVVVPGIQ